MAQALSKKLGIPYIYDLSTRKTLTYPEEEHRQGHAYNQQCFFHLFLKFLALLRTFRDRPEIRSSF